MQVNPYASPNHALSRPEMPKEPTSLQRFEGEVVDSIDLGTQRRFCTQATRRLVRNWKLLTILGLSLSLLIWFYGYSHSLFAILALLGTLFWLGMVLLFHQWRLQASLSEISQQGRFPVRGELFSEGFLLQGAGWQQFGNYQLISGICTEPEGSIFHLPTPPTRGAIGFRLGRMDPESSLEAFERELISLNNLATRTPLTSRLFDAVCPPLFPLDPIRFETRAFVRLRDHRGLSRKEWQWNRWSWISALMLRIHLTALLIGIIQMVMQADWLAMIACPLATLWILVRERRGLGLVFGMNPIVSELKIAIGEAGYRLHSNAVQTHILWSALQDVEVEEGVLMGRLVKGGIRNPLLREKWFEDPRQWSAVVQLATREIPPIQAGS